jgi:hypothetical protein
MGPNISEHQRELIIKRCERYRMKHAQQPEVKIGYIDIETGERWLGRVTSNVITWEIDTTPNREFVRDIPLKPLNAKPDRKQ